MHMAKYDNVVLYGPLSRDAGIDYKDKDAVSHKDTGKGNKSTAILPAAIVLLVLVSLVTRCHYVVHILCQVLQKGNVDPIANYNGTFIMVVSLKGALYRYGFVSAQGFDSECEDRYKALNGHSRCLPRKSHLLNQTVQNLIVDRHNRYRQEVSPPASNMRKLLADIAQRWADNCKLKHDEPSQRIIPGKFQVGQNIATSGTSISWSDVIDLWKNESFKFTYGNHVQLLQVGHYTQLIWATTGLLGCGQSKCGGTYFFVCNYGPGGNNGDISTPYIKGQSSCNGQQQCQSHLYDGCNGLVCLNEGTFNENNCTCSCPEDTHYLDGNNCPYAGIGYKEGSVPLPASSAQTSTVLFALLFSVVVGILIN
ncbi:hypothetical protein CHS0354_010330 [Potamilus streckersoni]|uniref:SCP domain-containing protein n=1 Tax=Potamilus streckersoni TaxID=2493646 RepID=A0AAE0TEY5_9BIVA|nr:hypothetical protein CHS0354_010330 [Potamilus streckersoni]